MRIIVLGAGAVGGLVGARLHEHGHDIVLVARGDHGRAMRDRGLRVEMPSGTVTLHPVNRTGRGHAVPRPVGGGRRGGSSLQSVVRCTRNVEADYLNGEIVLLGRQHGVPTPVNETLRRLANEVARGGIAPGTMTENDVSRVVS